MKSVLYRSPFIPREWIAACGCHPLSYTELQRSEVGPVPDLEGVCPFMRGFLNSAMPGDSLLALTTMCDQMRHGHVMIPPEHRGRAFLFNLPATCQTVHATEMYIAQLHRLGNFLAHNGGTEPDMEQLLHLMKARTGRTSTCDHKHIPGKIPVALLGGPVFAGDREVIEYIRESGGQIVLDGIEAGERTDPASFDLQAAESDPVGELARAYFSSIPDMFRRPNNQLYQWLEHWIAQRKPRGLIMIRQLWCDLWHGEADRVKNFINIPFLELDVNGGPLSIRNKTRIEAFMELLA